MTNDFIHKIQQAEIIPPDLVWNNIATDLDGSTNRSFVQKLALAELTPPAAAWNEIESRLQEPRSKIGTLINLNKGRLVAAAVIAALIFFSTTWLLNRSSIPAVAKKTPASTESVTEKKDVISSDTVINRPMIASMTKSRGVSPRKLIASRGSNPTPIRHALVESAGQSRAVQTNNNEELVNSAPSTVNTYIQAPDYFTVTAPNGQLVKISSKFSDAAAYFFNMSDDGNDPSWKIRFDNWRKKIISSPSFIPTAGNFLDIMELKELLKEQ